MSGTTTRAGFTLLELLIALAILVIGMVGIYAVFLTATRQHALAIDSTNAALAATTLLEDARARFAAQPDLPLDRRESGPVPGLEGFTYELRTSALGSDKLRVLIELELFWQRRGERTSGRYATIALRDVLPSAGSR